MDLASTRSALTTVRGGWRPTIVSGVLRENGGKLTHKQFVDRELIHFSNYDRALDPQQSICPWTADVSA
jgi:hypothetical protein